MEGSAMTQARGIRNNNPLNIRKGDKKWNGEIEGADKEFCTFATMGSGINAALNLIYTYMARYRLHTVERIIKRWAPPVENHTQAYIDFVCQQMKIAPNYPFGFQDVLCVTALIRAMALYESGLKGYDFTIVNEYLMVCHKKGVVINETDFETALQRARLNPAKD